MRPAFLDEMSWRMAEVYEAVTDRILINLARYFPYVKDSGEVKGAFEYQARLLAKMGQVTKESARIILDSLSGADEALKQSLEAAILDALKNEEPKLKKAAEKGLLHGPGFIPPEVDAGTMQAFQAYYRQSADKLNLVNTVMLESTEQAYRATVADVTARISRTQGILNEATGEVVTGVTSINQAIRDGVKKMVDNGLTGFVDHGGHRWSPEAYVAMDVKTTMFNTARAAVWERSEQYGNDLYQVSSHAGARPLCYPWQAKVISRSDWTGEVEDLDGNKVHVYAQSETSYGEPAGLFGINCKHYPMTFIPGFSTLKGEPQDPEENAKTYAESQQQRALERKLREEKRDLEVMKAQGADPVAIRLQQDRVHNASAAIDDFCEETGRTRRRERETAPVRATWPGEQGSTERYQGGYIPTDTPPSGPDDGGTSSANIPPAAQAAPQEQPQEQPLVEEPIVPVETETAFVPAKTIQEAEEFAQRFTDDSQFGAVGVSYQGVSVDVANVVNETLSDFYDTYDVKKFGGVIAPAGNTKLGRMIDGAVAGYSPPRHSFILNRKILKTIETADEYFRQEQELITAYLKNPENYSIGSASARRVFDASSTSGRATVPTNVQESVWHELGHSLARGLRQSPYYDNVKEGFPVYAERISGYATSDFDEYLAESFCAMKKGESIDPILATAFESLKRR